MSSSHFNEVMQPHLVTRGFSRSGKAFQAVLGRIHMTVWADPGDESRRLSDVTVACAPKTDPLETVFHFSQIYAAKGATAGTYQDVAATTRFEVAADHFLHATLPFIDSTRSFDQIVARILRGEVSSFFETPYPLGAVTTAYRVASVCDTTPGVSEVLEFARQQQFDREDHDYLVEWAEQFDVPIDLQPARSRVRSALARLSTRGRHPRGA